MKKVIKLNEEMLENLVKKVIKEEKLSESDGPDWEMTGARNRRNYTASPKETEVSSVFGKYYKDIPPMVLRYLRKNPEAVVKRLYKIYGEKMFDYLPTRGGDEE